MICERKILFDVDPQCFNPPPKVMSAVMSLIKTKDFDELCEIEKFQKFSKRLF